MPKLIDHEARRQELAEAVWRVILREGIAAASVRSVAAEAAVSTGSLRHIFATQAELIEYSMRLAVDRATDRIRALQPRPTVRETVEAVLGELLPLDGDRRAELEINVLLVASAISDPALAVVRDETKAAIGGACTRMLALLAEAGELAPGTDHALESQRLHALVDGLALHLIHEPAEADTAWAARVLRRHLDSLR